MKYNLVEFFVGFFNVGMLKRALLWETSAGNG